MITNGLQENGIGLNSRLTMLTYEYYDGSPL